MDSNDKLNVESKLWGGRFRCGLDPVMEAFNSSLNFDKRLFSADIKGSIAYAKALERCGLISENEYNLIESGLKKIENEWENELFEIKFGDEDIHSANERRLKELIGDEIGGKLHTGRSRNDQIATDMKIWLKNAMIELRDLLVNLIEVILGKAKGEMHVIMPGYTHLQRAQAVYLSHWLLSFAFMFQHDCQRIKSCLSRTDICPLGSGAISGNPFNIDRDLLSNDLGFKSCTMNSMHAVADRDFIAEFQFWAALTVIHFSKLAEDLLLFSSKEFDFIEIADSFCTGSSLMPQKKNADSLELMRGKAGRIIGNTTALLVVMKGIPSTFNKDLQEDKEGMFDTFDTINGIIQIAIGVIRTMKVNEINCNKALTSDMLATDIAYYLVRKGVSFRESHDITGKIVALAEELKCQLHDLPFNKFKDISDKFSEDIDSVWNFENSVNQYIAKGGTGRSSVLQQIDFIQSWIKKQSKDLENIEEK